MPVPSALVFHPEKFDPVFNKEPCDASVVLAAIPLAVVGAGTVEDADVCPFPL